jgi:hypothetical protein
VAALEWAISQGKMVYVHCTAGLGRAPAVAIAYLYWFHGMDVSFWFHTLTCYLQNVPLLLSLSCSLYVTDSVTPLCVIYLWDPDGSNVAIKVPNPCACFLRAGCLYLSFNVRKFGITCSISEWFIGLQWKKSTWKVFFALQWMWTTCLFIYSNCSAIPDGDCI